MSGSWHILEMILYSLLNFTPYIAIAFYPFRNSLRFSKRITTLLIVAAAILQVFILQLLGDEGVILLGKPDVCVNNTDVADHHMVN